METTATQSNIQDFANETDSNGLEYKITKLNDTIFKMAENKNDIVFLMGNNIIEKIEKDERRYPWKVWKTKRALNKINTKLMIPITAALIETVLKQMEKTKVNTNTKNN